MTRIRAFAAVCVLLVLAGSSVSLAFGDAPRDVTESSAQIAAQTGETGSVEMQILSSGHHILQDESDDFVVRVVSDGSHGILLGVKTDLGESASVEFRHPDVKRMPPSWIYPEYVVLGYIPERDTDTVEDVPIEISPDGKFSAGSHAVQFDSISRSAAMVASDTFDLRVFCSVECGMMWILTQVWENIGVIIALLGLLIAFFGRKRIWNALGFPREREDGIEGGEPPDAGTADNEPSDAVGDGQRPGG